MRSCNNGWLITSPVIVSVALSPVVSVSETELVMRVPLSNGLATVTVSRAVPEAGAARVGVRIPNVQVTSVPERLQPRPPLHPTYAVSAGSVSERMTPLAGSLPVTV